MEKTNAFVWSGSTAYCRKSCKVITVSYKVYVITIQFLILYGVNLVEKAHKIFFQIAYFIVQITGLVFTIFPKY